MNTIDIPTLIADALAVSRTDAKVIIDAVVAAVVDAAARDEEVAISGSGKFKVKDSAAREGRNSSTGARIRLRPRISSALPPPRR